MNFYEYLGIKPSATETDIKKAFREKAKKTHPDYNKKNTAFYEMVELNLIRDTLLNPERRKKYDIALQAGKAGTTIEKPSTKQGSRLYSLYTAMKDLFIYRCRICGLEMSSTWQGYCLYHFLEVSGQLNNPDHTFHYHGYTFHWTPPEQEKRQNTHRKAPKPSKAELLFFFLSIATTILILIAFTRMYLLPSQ